MAQEIKKLSELKDDDHNANKGTDRGRDLLEDSLSKYGAGRSILLDKNGRIIAGNKTADAARKIGLDDVVVVRTKGDKVVAVLREDLDIDSEAGRMLAYADNRVGEEGLSWDIGIVQSDVDSGLNLSEFWSIEELHGLGVSFDVDFDVNFDDGKEADEIPAAEGVPDTIWPSDNEWGIPLLDASKQADAFDLPIQAWGSVARTKAAGTFVFYTDDYRFNALWSNPNAPVLAGCVNAAEPNFSIYKDLPPAVVLYRTYQKRWLARYWQSMGVRIFVDLNVNPEHYESNMIGVPKGWRAYATRGYSDRLDCTLKELELAEAHADGPVLFLVYGGGKAVKAWCKEYAGRGAVWSEEEMDRGRYSNDKKEGK